MKKNVILVLVIFILIVAVIMLLLYQKSERERLDIIKERLTYNLIQLQLIELKNVIKEQSTSHSIDYEEINEKFEYLTKGIAITLSVSSLAKGISKEDEELLFSLYEHFSHYVDKSEGVIYSESEWIEIIKIGESIKLSGFDESETISENWSDTIIKLRKLSANINE